MRFAPSFTGARVALTIWLLTIAAASAAAQEPSAPADDDKLVSQAELNAIQLSIVDEKMAMSLAVETHVQHELTEFALTGVHDERVRRLAEKKLRLYARLLKTLEELTGGKTVAVLARAPRDGELQVTSFNPDAATPVSPAVAVVTKTAAVVTAEGSPAAPPAVARTAKKRGGLSSILENTTTNALVKVRLEIAEHYAELLRGELAALAGADFDRHYMRIEVFNQIQVLSMLRVFEQHASKDFAAILHHASTAAEEQVAEARQVLAQFPADNVPVEAVEAAGP